MKKYLSILLLAAVLFTGLLILTGCEKEDTEEKAENITYSAPEESIENQIKASSEEYFKMVFDPKIDIKIFNTIS